MKRLLRGLLFDWRTKKYLALILAVIIALVGIRISPDSSKKQLAAQAEATSEGEEEASLANGESLYQFPVELGYPADSNYNGTSSTQYLKKTYDTVNEGRGRTDNEESDSEDNNASLPSIKMLDDNYRKLHASFGDISCTNSGDLVFQIVDTGNVGISKATVMHADRIGYIIDGFADAKYSVENNYYGKLTYNCIDNGGNVSNLVSQYIIVENTIPNIQIAEGDVYEAPGTVRVEITDGGRIVSGIHEDSIECYINDNKYTPKDMKSVKSCSLADNLEVSTDTTFTMEFPRDGNYDIQITVSDNCGNTARLKYYINVVNNKVIIS